MSESYTELRKDEWDNLNYGRVVLHGPNDSRILRNRRISFSLLLNTRLNLNPNISIADVEFSDCIFIDPVIIGDFLSAGNIHFNDCKFESEVKINQRDNVRFEGSCTFKRNLSIMSFDRVTDLSNIIVDGQLWIAGRSGASLSMSGITANKQPTFLGIDFPSVHITKCEFGNIQFTGLTDVDGDISIDNSKIAKIDFFAMKVGGAFRITDSELEDISSHDENKLGERLVIEGSTIKSIALPLSCFNEFEISGNNIEYLELTGDNKKDCVAILQRNTISKMLLNSIHNDGQLSFREVQLPRGGIIQLKSSNLGKTDFILCNFEKAQLEFQSSKMTEIFVSETEFPKNVVTNGQINHRQAQLAFGQISAAFQKQGDTVRALDYQAREIEAHYRQLNLIEKKTGKISFTKISLWLNKWSNDFGRNWQRAVLFSILAGLFFFYLVVISSKEYNFGFGFGHDPWLIPSYYRFMNPLRFFELESIFRMGQEKPFLTLNGWSYFFDLMGRVFVAYGFYQTIQAFRKYGRK